MQCGIARSQPPSDGGRRKSRTVCAGSRGRSQGIRKMYEGDRYCIDVLDQVASARNGLEATAQVILEDHVNGCISDALNGGDAEEKRRSSWKRFEGTSGAHEIASWEPLRVTVSLGRSVKR